MDQGSEFYNRLVKPWLHGNSTEMYPKHSERKFVVVQRFIRAVKNTTGIKNVYMDRLNKIADKYDKIYYRTIKMKNSDVYQDTYIDYGVEQNEKIS